MVKDFDIIDVDGVSDDWGIELSKEKEKRPPCPECGSGNITSAGNRWLCKDCSRKWRKIYRGRKLPDYSKRPHCPFCFKQRVFSHGKYWECYYCGKNFLKKTILHRDLI